MSTQLQISTDPTSTLPAPAEWAMILQMGQALVKSGMIPSSIKTPEAAAAIILKGRELAIPPMQAFSHIHIIQGRPVCSSELMLALLARGGVTWDWVKDGSEGLAEILFKRAGFSPVPGRFSMEDAKRAGLLGKDTWKNYPASMLRARAIASGARMIGPDLLAGMSYTPEEMGAEVNRDGEPLEGRQPVQGHAEVVDTRTGEIMQQESPQAVQHGTAKGEAPYYRFLKRCAALKAEMRDPEAHDPDTQDAAYYRVLKEFDLTSSKDVGDDLGLMRSVVEALEAEKVAQAIDPIEQTEPATA